MTDFMGVTRLRYIEKDPKHLNIENSPTMNTDLSIGGGFG